MAHKTLPLGSHVNAHTAGGLAEGGYLGFVGELSHVSRVVFIPDYNTAAVVTQGVYKTKGQFWTMVVPKAEVIPELFTTAEAEQLLEQGALRLEWAGYHSTSPQLILTAIGAYHLEEEIDALDGKASPHGIII